MPQKPHYVNLKDITEQQEDVMKFIVTWARNQKTPIPKKKIIASFKIDGVSPDTVEWSLGILLKKGYIRRAYVEKQNTVAYVQLRTL